MININLYNYFFIIYHYAFILISSIFLTKLLYQPLMIIYKNKSSKIYDIVITITQHIL